jgi:TatD DNase family protein
VSGTPPPIVDTHCHLTLEEFDRDRSAVLDRAVRSGIQAIVVPAIDLKTSREVVALAEQHQHIYAAVGIHPHAAGDWSEASRRELRQLAASPRVVAIGEIGLDFYRDRAPRPAQLIALLAQLDLAAEIGLPVILHSRHAAGEVLHAVQEWSSRLASPLRARCGVMHAFQGDAHAAMRATDAGLFIGIGGPLTYPSAARDLHGALSDVPQERLLLETDAPYLPPQGHRGERNEPAFLPLVAAVLADLRGWGPSEAAYLTTANASNLFGWAHATDDRHIL